MSDIISLIIPTYNRAHFLPEAIQSVLDQTADNWNLIIVDDGSTDDTKKVVERYLKDPRISYSYQNNYGVSAARNKGVEIAKGDYIIFLDSDDLIYRELLENVNKSLLNHPDLVCWEVNKRINDKIFLWKPQKLEKIYNNITASFLAGSICYKKEIFIEAGGFDPKMTFGENYELGMRVSQISNLKIEIIKKPLLEYNISENRESNSVLNRLNSYLHLYQKHKSRYLQDKVSNSTINYLLGYIHEKSDKIEAAEKFYRSSFQSSRSNYKALLKIIYFKFFRK